MTRKKTTTVVFSNAVQEIKDRLTPIFGLQETISAGLILFDKVSDSEKIKTISKIKADEKKLKQEKTEDKPQPDKVIESIRKAAKKLIAIKSKDFTTIIASLPEDEQNLLNEIRNKLGPEAAKEKNKNG